MKKLPAKRNPMAKALAKPQFRSRIKPDKRRAIEAKRMIEESSVELVSEAFRAGPLEFEIRKGDSA
jgi:hypothetical protein